MKLAISTPYRWLWLAAWGSNPLPRVAGLDLTISLLVRTGINVVAAQSKRSPNQKVKA